jgi:hypothetical protein
MEKLNNWLRNCNLRKPLLMSRLIKLLLNIKLYWGRKRDDEIKNRMKNKSQRSLKNHLQKSLKNQLQKSPKNQLRKRQSKNNRRTNKYVLLLIIKLFHQCIHHNTHNNPCLHIKWWYHHRLFLIKKLQHNHFILHLYNNHYMILIYQ